MERSVLFFTLALVCFYLILDEFVGKKRISGLLEGFGTSESPAPAPAPDAAAPVPFNPDQAAPDTGGIIG